MASFFLFCKKLKWLNEVRGNEPISEDELKVKFNDLFDKNAMIDGPEWDHVLSEQCTQIAKQYSDSKLTELEKWIDEQFKHADSLDKQDDTVTRYFAGKKDGLSLTKIKLQSLK